jgi:DtxR family transcriptional regulator, Mn-dependent transcriptional regulator
MISGPPLSERLTDAIDVYLKHPRYDPHGEPIPRKGETALPELRISLASAPIHRPLRIARIQEPAPELLRYLERIGIRIGQTVVVLEKAPLDGPLTLRLDPAGPDRSISLDTADRILVEKGPGG